MHECSRLGLQHRASVQFGGTNSSSQQVPTYVFMDRAGELTAGSLDKGLAIFFCMHQLLSPVV